MKRLITLALGVLIGRAIARPEETKAMFEKVVGQVRARTSGGSSGTPSGGSSGGAHLAEPTPYEPEGDSFPASDPPSGWAGSDRPPN
jgi:hypothetical protein